MKKWWVSSFQKDHQTKPMTQIMRTGTVQPNSFPDLNKDVKTNQVLTLWSSLHLAGIPMNPHCMVQVDGIFMCLMLEVFRYTFRLKKWSSRPVIQMGSIV